MNWSIVSYVIGAIFKQHLPMPLADTCDRISIKCNNTGWRLEATSKGVSDASDVNVKTR